MIKAILFDYDGVLTLHATGSYSTCLYLSKTENIDFNTLLTEYRKYNMKLLEGKITHLDIWDSLCGNLNKKIEIDRLYDAFKKTPLNRPLYKLIRKIKKSYKTGLITDNKCDRMNILIRKQKLHKIFDSIIVSAAIGSGKQKDIIFKKAFADLQVLPNECIFIDNQERNLEIPAKLGVKTIYYNPETDNIKRLKSKLNCRMFADIFGIPEDPATGSANGCLAAYLLKHQYYNSPQINIKVEQGFEIGRKSILHLKADMENKKIRIQIGGKVFLVGAGSLVP